MERNSFLFLLSTQRRYSSFGRREAEKGKLEESSVGCEDMWSCSGSTAQGLSRTGKEEEKEVGYEDKE